MEESFCLFELNKGNSSIIMNFRSCVGSFIQLIQLLFITDWGLEGTFISKNPAHWPSPCLDQQSVFLCTPPGTTRDRGARPRSPCFLSDHHHDGDNDRDDNGWLPRWWSCWPLLVPETPVPSPIKDLDQRSYSVPAVEILGSWQQWIVFIGSICRAVEKIGDPGLRRLPIFSRPRYSQFTPVVTSVFTPVVTLVDPLVTFNRIPQ